MVAKLAKKDGYAEEYLADRAEDYDENDDPVGATNPYEDTTPGQHDPTQWIERPPGNTWVRPMAVQHPGWWTQKFPSRFGDLGKTAGHALFFKNTGSLLLKRPNEAVIWVAAP